MENETERGRQIQSVARSAEILHLLHELSSATVSNIAGEVDLTPGTVHTHLSTLCEHGLVSRNEGGEYGLSLELISMGEHVRNRSVLFRAGREIVDKLSIMSGETVHLVTEQRGREMILWEAFGRNAVGTDFYIHNRERPNRYLHYSGSGKAILSRLSDDKVDEIIDKHGLVQQTDQTITDREELQQHLQEIRELGYAFNDEEGVVGIRAVGAPIFAPNGDLLGAISLSAPAAKMTDDIFRTEIPEVVIRSANLIEVNLQAVLAR